MLRHLRPLLVTLLVPAATALLPACSQGSGRGGPASPGGDANGREPDAAGAAVSDAGAAPAENRPLSAAAMRALVEGAVHAERPDARLEPMGSNNPHLGGLNPLSVPIPDTLFFSATVETADSPLREYLAVTADGEVYRRVDAARVEALVSADRVAAFTDQQLLEAAYLRVHAGSPANQDGWRVLARPEDFTSITFNMAAIGPGLEAQRQAARTIVAPVVERGADGHRAVFYAWHLIGGELRRWRVRLGQDPRAESELLGRFGGGGYD